MDKNVRKAAPSSFRATVSHRKSSNLQPKASTLSKDRTGSPPAKKGAKVVPTGGKGKTASAKRDVSGKLKKSAKPLALTSIQAATVKKTAKAASPVSSKVGKGATSKTTPSVTTSAALKTRAKPLSKAPTVTSAARPSPNKVPSPADFTKAFEEAVKKQRQQFK